jgi:hypothetical protein
MPRIALEEATYARITGRDHLAEDDVAVDSRGEGIHGPGTAPDELVARLKDGDGIEFRMGDDDGELYYSGRFVPADLSDGEEGFGPPGDFGAPDNEAIFKRILDDEQFRQALIDLYTSRIYRKARGQQ